MLAGPSMEVVAATILWRDEERETREVVLVKALVLVPFRPQHCPE